MTPNHVAAELEGNGLIAIIRATSSESVCEAAQALARGGLRALEITLTTPGALEAIARLRTDVGAEMRVGAGTILRRDDAERALDAGAEFIVTPTLQIETIALCRERQAPIFCGCFSPTEALAAHQAGADFIKLFPASVLGAEFVRAILAPLPFLKIVATGGIAPENLGDFVDAGCVGAAIGGNLVSNARLQNHDWEELSTQARRYIEALATAREKKA